MSQLFDLWLLLEVWIQTPSRFSSVFGKPFVFTTNFTVMKNIVSLDEQRINLIACQVPKPQWTRMGTTAQWEGPF